MRRAHTRACILIAILLACCACAFALDPSLDISQYAHTAWTIREGFFRGNIYSIAQGKDGYLWLGTEFGLLRFDGNRYVPWQPPAGQNLPGNGITKLLVTSDGTLWIGTYAGLVSWSGGKLTRYSELDNKFVASMVQDHEGTVWVGTLGSPFGRLCAIKNGDVQCYGQDGALGRMVASLYEDSTGALWVAAQSGLWCWRPGLPKHYAMSTMELKDLNSGDQGELLIAMSGGIRQFSDGKSEPYAIPHGKPVSTNRLLRDHDGGLWIGTLDQGLVHVYHGRADVFSKSDGLSGDVIFSLFEDREGSVWVSTNGGLDRFRDLAVSTISIKQGLSTDAAWSILAVRDGSVWVGSRHGLNKWSNGQISMIREAGGQRDDAPQSLFQDDRGRIWAFTEHGLVYVKDGRFVLVSAAHGGQVHSITGDNEGNLWLSENASLLHLREGHEIEQIPWSRMGRQESASVLLSDREHGGLWLGFWRGGGVLYFKDGQVRASYTAADGLTPSAVSDLQLDNSGALWVSTQDGLNRIKDGRIATLTSRNGLPCNTVHWTMEDEDHTLWAYTACGIVRIAPTELDAWIADPKRTIEATVWDAVDGVRLRSTAASFYGPRAAKSADGKLWFVTGDGVQVIDPRHLPFNKLPPPIRIEQITADHKIRWQNILGEAPSNLRLPRLTRDLQIEYTALSLVAPEKIRFKYKLEGYDRDWQDVGNRRQTFYTNLSPANYRFRVIASNNSGVWNEEGASLDFVIPPAWYQTNWFRGLCAAAFLTLLYGVYRVRVGQLRAQEEKFREAIESIPAIAFVTLPDGNLTFVNKGWTEYTGMTVEQASGMGWQKAVHPDDRKRVVAKWQSGLASGESIDYEARYRRAADGHYRWFTVKVVPLRDKRGKTMTWSGTATDIEDRKRAEQLQSDIAHINRVSMMGELAASISHELKQPITATMTNASTSLRWLKRADPNLEEVRDATERIVEDSSRATEIIDRLRSLYKKAPPKRELVEVNEVVREMVVLLRGEGSQQGVSVRMDLEENLPKIIADRVQLQQVLMNLMLNGIEAMKETGGVLTAKSEVDPVGRVTISVSDTGVGLPAESADQIFNAFFTTKPQGSGMGLAISRSIVESHGGRLWATPNEGRGATFHFTVPSASETAKVPAAEV